MSTLKSAWSKQKGKSALDKAKASDKEAKQIEKTVATTANRLGEPALTDYEKERAHRIQRNAALIEQLQLKQLVSDLASSIQSKPQKKPRKPAQPRRIAGKASCSDVLEPARRSARQKSMSSDDTDQQSLVKKQAIKDLEGEDLVSCEEYFRQKDCIEPGISVSGSFQGWVNPELCQRYGIAASAEQVMMDSVTAIQTVRSSANTAANHGRGWSKAQIIAAKQLRTNPNAYFYRHVAPHEQQAQGDWTAEEHSLFMKTVRENGAGDRWGLFSSYIPQRVGYQCSNYYRDMVIALGLVFDPRYRMNKSGKAVYIG